MGVKLSGVAQRSLADVILFGITLAELVLLAWLSAAFEPIDVIYVAQHLLVLGIALTRSEPAARDESLAALLAVGASYAYPYAQVIALRSSL